MNTIQNYKRVEEVAKKTKIKVFTKINKQLVTIETLTIEGFLIRYFKIFCNP